MGSLKYLVCDLETGTKEMHKRKGNPWYNPIVAIGLKPSDFDALADYVYDDNDHLDGILRLWLSEESNYQILVGHNIKFDLLYLWKLPVFQDWLSRGGRIYDTQLAEYMLSGQRHKYPALRDIAVNKYGCAEREKFMEAYWDKGIDTMDIPHELVLNDVRSDVLDTEQVMLQQLAKAKKAGVYKLIMAQMEGLLATTEMEYQGIYINRDILINHQEQIQNQLSELYRKAQTLAAPYWLENAGKSSQINLSSPSQLSVLLFGGEIISVEDQPILNELGVPEVYKSGTRRGEIKTKKGKVTKTIKGFNLNPLEEWGTSKEGIYQTNEKVLDRIARRSDTEVGKLAAYMLETRELEKLLGTYYTAMEPLIYEDGCIRGSINHVSTDTGRTSSTKPNLQNIPRS